MPDFICPHCSEPLSYFNYALDTTGTEWGDASFSSNMRYAYEMNLESNNSEVNDTDNLRFSCPECYEDIGDSLIEEFLAAHYQERPTDNPQVRQIPQRPISDATQIITKQESFIQIPYNQGTQLKVCPDCAYQYVAREDDECPHCYITKTKLTV